MAKQTSYLPIVSAFDPKTRAAGSIDPLGAMRPYAFLADRLMPGLTTITTRVRYLSMTCSALFQLEQAEETGQIEIPSGPSGIGFRRKAVEPIERLWVLACAKHGEDTADLRGIRSATNYLKRVEAREESEIGTDFRILKSQARTGGVATYWCLLTSSDLVQEDGRLGPLGKRLGALNDRGFKWPTNDIRETLRLLSPDNSRKFTIPLETLQEWGKKANPGRIKREEMALLRDAILDNATRKAVAEAIIGLEKKWADLGNWERPQLKLLAEQFNQSEEAKKLGLGELVPAILTFEAFHEAMLAIFNTVLWWATRHGAEAVNELYADTEYLRAIDRLAKQAQAFVAGYDAQPQANKDAQRNFHTLAAGLKALGSAKDVTNRLLAYHREVQSGRYDNGCAKQEWVTEKDSKFMLTRNRWGIMERPAPARGTRLTHPYRLTEFALMLAETGVIQK